MSFHAGQSWPGWGSVLTGIELGIELAGQCPGNIKPDKPVGLGPADSGVIKVVVDLTGLQPGKAFTDGIISLEEIHSRRKGFFSWPFP